MFQIPIESQTTYVALKVKELEPMRDYYQNIIGLNVRQESETEVRLGTSVQDLVVLKHHPEGNSAPRQSGLYHLALLLPNRSALASWLRRFMSLGQKLEGTADHAVSEALYFSDPEGNGIEVYADRSKDQWEWEGEQVKTTTLPLDLPNLYRSASQNPMKHLPDDAIMGHVHLKVADIKKTRAFYIDTLGFNLMTDMTRMGAGALFAAAGTYHHHLGLNTWHSQNRPADPQALGLDHFAVRVPDSKTIEQLTKRVKQADYSFELVDQQLELNDPSGNKLVFTT